MKKCVKDYLQAHTKRKQMVNILIRQFPYEDNSAAACKI